MITVINPVARSTHPLPRVVLTERIRHRWTTPGQSASTKSVPPAVAGGFYDHGHQSCSTITPPATADGTDRADPPQVDYARPVGQYQVSTTRGSGWVL